MQKPRHTLTSKPLMKAFLALIFLYLSLTDVLPQTAVQSEDARQHSDSRRGSLSSAYDRIHPYYFKYCGTTKYHPHEGKGFEGGITGHALFYLKGVCKNEVHSPSGIKLCEKSRDFTNPETGVGLSVDGGLKNANFFVIPGLTMFLGAGLLPGESLTTASKENIIQRALKNRIFSGIDFHGAFIPRPLLEDNREEYIARYVFGTDYAISMARNLYCINIPMPRRVMSMVVDHLNQLETSRQCSINKPFRGGKRQDKSYHWHGIYDNCTHPPINALAAIGVIPPKKINLAPLRQLFHLAIPANTLLQIHRNSNEDPIDVNSYFENPVRRNMFEQHGWIPQQAGNVTEFIQIKLDNEIYRENDWMFVLPHLLQARVGKIKKITQDERFIYVKKENRGLATNQRFYLRKVRHGLEKIKRVKKTARFRRGHSIKVNNAIEKLEGKIKLFRSGFSSLTKDRDKRIFKRDLHRFEKELERLKISRNYVNFVNKFEVFLQKQETQLSTN